VQGFVLKHEQVRLEPQVPSIVTQVGLSGGTQHEPLRIVPGGQTPPSGMLQVPPGDG
jgi:hypothetical protein